MASASPFDGLPSEILMDILSRLRWTQQVVVRRVSRRWMAAVDACLARRRELHIAVSKDRGIRDFDTVIRFLENMPALKRLCIFKATSQDVFPRVCDKLVLDLETAERLCACCPQLEQISLSCRDEGPWASVETLLRRLPRLRVLDLGRFNSRLQFLSLLPKGLQKLYLEVPEYLSPDLFRHLERCPQLRELTLLARGSEHAPLPGGHYPSLGEAQLTAALTACPQLEVLKVRRLSNGRFGHQMPDWVGALELCPQLRKLHIQGHIDLDLVDLLDTCDRLERLSLIEAHIYPSTMDSTYLRQYPGLTYLNLCGTSIEYATFCQLANLLPGLRHLIIGQGSWTVMTEDDLVNGLPHFTSLRVLELEIISAPEAIIPVLSAVSDLPLEVLAIPEIKDPRGDMDIAVLEEWKSSGGMDDMEDVARYVATLIRRSSKLTALRIPWDDTDLYKSFVDALTSAPSSADEPTSAPPREITLLVSGADYVARELATLPRNVILVEDQNGAWEKVTGSPQPKSYCSCRLD